MPTIATAAGVGLALALTAAGPVAAAPAAKPGSAEAERIKSLEAKLEQSLALIQQLSQRVQDLEKRPATAAPAPVAAVVPAVKPADLLEAQQRIADVEQGVRELTTAAANMHPADTGVPFHGFLDVGYTSFSKQAPEQRSGFRLGTFDVYLTPQFGANVRTLIELAFEYDNAGSLGIDAERLQIGYAFSDQLVLWGGRFHTPYGYWNTAFHHGAQLQTSITRPRFIAFEDQGGILPAHTVGALATGKTATALGKFSYDLYAGNGDRVIDGVLDYNASGDDNSSPIYGTNLALSPAAVPGLTLGLHALQSKIGGNNAAGTLTGSSRSRVIGAYGYYEGDSVEVIAEYYRFSNRDLAPGGQSRSSQAAFLQVGYNLVDRWTAFARYEKASLKSDDVYFALLTSGSSYHQSTVGLRYDVDPRAALKFQFDSNKDLASPLGTINSLRAQYAVRF
jgi:hypothetical protein